LDLAQEQAVDEQMKFHGGKGSTCGGFYSGVALFEWGQERIFLPLCSE
jgi:hypothetical protein